MIDIADLILSYEDGSSDTFIRKSIKTNKSKSDYMADLLIPISNYTCTKVWRLNSYVSLPNSKKNKNFAYHVEYVFFGMEKDVDKSIYIFNLFKNFILEEVSKHKQTIEYKSDKTSPLIKINSFIRGIRSKLIDALFIFKDQLNYDECVNKCEILVSEMEKINLSFKKSKKYHTSMNSQNHSTEGDKIGRDLVKAINRDVKIRKILSK